MAGNMIPRKRMLEMMVIPYKGNHFFVDNSTARPEKTDGGIEKRKVNEIVAKDRRWNFVLDCYAGFGISTCIFAKHAKKVVALEKDPTCASAMWFNLFPFYSREEIGHLSIIPEDNLIYLREALKAKQEPPDLVDLDPFGSCEGQLELVMKWMKDGALLLTNGQIKPIFRDLPWVTDKKHYPDIKNRYTGNKSVDWPCKYFIPKLQERYKRLRVVHFYAHPTSVRLVCEVGKFKFQTETLKKLKERPNYLDQFKEMKKDEEKNGKQAKKS